MRIVSKIARLIPEQVIHLFWRFTRHFPVYMMRFFGAYFGLSGLGKDEKTKELGEVRGLSVLVLHGLEPESRQTTVDYVSAFLNTQYAVNVTTANIFGFMPGYLSVKQFDLAVITTEALSHRTTPFWPSLEQRIVSATAQAKRTVMMPQDDYTDSAKLDALAVKAKVGTIYSPLIKGLDIIYPQASANGVEFVEALTGYFDASKSATRSQKAKAFRARSIDIGQRVRKLPPQFGEIGIRKYEIAEVVCAEGKANGFSVDFSSKPQDVLLGEAWFEFLGNTKFTVSCRGGSSIVDPKGRIAARLSNLNKYFPRLSEARAFQIASFPSHISGDFDAVSPRLFDAAMMGVCQILLEDEYMGMEPWKHYIPLKRDYSNLPEVFAAMQNYEQVESIVGASQEFLLDPTRFSYESLVTRMLETELGGSDLPLGESVLEDVDSRPFESGGVFDEHRFTKSASLSRTLINAGVRKVDQQNTRSVSVQLALSIAELADADTWLTRYFDRPTFPELLIVRWCPLTWFLNHENEKVG